MRLDGDEPRGEEEARLQDDEQVDPHDESDVTGGAVEKEGVLPALLDIVVF